MLYLLPIVLVRVEKEKNTQETLVFKEINKKLRVG